MLFPYALIVFNSTHTAIKSKTVLTAINPKIVPTLRQISESCGMSIMLKLEDSGTAQQLLIDHQITEFRLYEIDKIGKEIQHTLITTDDYN